MVKQIKFLQSTFFKNDNGNGGAMLQAITTQPKDTILIHSLTKKHGRLWGYSTYSNFLDKIDNNYGLYEVIHSFPHKVYFDIDAQGDYELQNFINNIKRIILRFFNDADMAISGSSVDGKTSLHIVINNYHIHNEDDRVYMKTLTKHIHDTYDDAFDWKVYTKNRFMKCINQSKLDLRIQNIIEQPNYKKHIITAFFNSSTLPLPKLPEPVMEKIHIAKSQNTFDLSSLPKLKRSCPDDIDYDTITPEVCLSLLPINKEFNHDYTHLVARFCHTHSLSFDTFFSWYSHKNNSYQAKQKWINHFNNLPKFPPVHLDRMKKVMATFYPHIFKDIHYRKFVQTFNLPEDNIELIETIDQDTFKKDKKYIIHNVGMGGGKTAQTIDFLKDKTDFLWIAPNKALASNTKKRFEDNNIKITHYLSVSTKKKNAGELNKCNKLIAVLNSIHYITQKSYGIIIIDEIETLLDKFLGDFMEQGTRQLKRVIWETFINLLRNAHKVILLDAFITTKTINLLQSINKEDSMVIYKRKFEPQTRTIVYQKDFKYALNDVIEKITNGNKVFIFYPYKNDAGGIYSMERVYKTIQEKTGKKGVFYNADVDDIVKNELKNVNSSWEDKSFIITNNILTCGVNYEKLDFDYKTLFIAPFNSPRDIIQVSYRARYLSTGIINICYMGKALANQGWLDDTSKFNCPIYTNLYNDILTEKKAPLKRSFDVFCNKARYKRRVDENKLQENIGNELDELLQKQECGYSYKQIEDIDTGDAEYLQQICLSQQATLYEKAQLQKYFYIKDFTEEGASLKYHDDDCDTIIGDAWNANFFFFFKKLQQLIKDDHNIFKLITDFNGTQLFHFENIHKIKLPDELLDLIFTQFKFKTITRDSKPVKILQTIYNTYFNKCIIKTRYRKGKHIEYYTDYYEQGLYEFSLKHLKIHK